MIDLKHRAREFSKAAQAVFSDIDKYLEYYARAKNKTPPIIRLNSDKFQPIEKSMHRPKIEEKEFRYSGIPLEIV